MDQLAWILSLILAFLVAPLVLWSRRQRRRRRAIPRVPNAQVAQEAIVRAPPATERSTSSATRRLRRRAGAGGASTSSASVPAVVSTSERDAHGEDEDSDEIKEYATYYRPKQSKKKNERKQEKEARREAEIAARDVRKEKQDRHAEMRRRKDEEREAEERRREEEAEKLKLKEEAESAAEFDKWKIAFSVETEGTQEQDVQEGKGLLNDFVDYIKTHKCVPLESLAAEFNLRTQDCIDRVVALEQMGRISGVMDERGKYIYISPEEMRAVADYIKRLGRVSISHLASRSNEFIDLETKTLATDCAQEANAEEATTSADVYWSGSQITY